MSTQTSIPRLSWGSQQDECVNAACDILYEDNGNGAIVSPTKVGYIIMTTGRKGLERKFELKQRPLRKPGVVLCTSPEHVEELAQTNEKIRELYNRCAAKSILLGCILPWNATAANQYIPKDGSEELVMDARSTSCFVIHYGTPSELICRRLWEVKKKLTFASSANPSGKGNRGVLESTDGSGGVGERILSGVDLVIEGDNYVRSQQNPQGDDPRYEQGVMVSMVNQNDGALTDVPFIIRKGLALDRIMVEMSKVYDSFDYRHGKYH